jgi:hypothetical protein
VALARRGGGFSMQYVDDLRQMRGPCVVYRSPKSGFIIATAMEDFHMRCMASYGVSGAERMTSPEFVDDLTKWHHLGRRGTQER